MSRHVGLRRGCALKSGTGVVAGTIRLVRSRDVAQWVQERLTIPCARKLGAVPRGLVVRDRLTAEARIRWRTVTTSTSRRSCRSDAARITTNTAIRIKAGSLDHQRLALAESFECARRLCRASKARRLGRDVVTPDTMDGPSGESICPHASDTSTCTTTSTSATRTAVARGARDRRARR